MKILEDLQGMRRADPGDMLGKISKLAPQCRHGWDLGLGSRLPPGARDCRSLLILGMGGSAIGGDLLQGLFGDNLSRPVAVSRYDEIPPRVNRETLVFAISYSGNTQETLSACRQALAKKARVAVVTSGGKLAAWAKQQRLPLIQIPPGWPPRTAVGYTTFTPAGLLARCGWLKKSAFSPKRLGPLEGFIQKELSPEVPPGRNPAKRIARELFGRLPILYGSAGGWEGVVYRWRTQIEENAKTLSFHHLFPEMTHNEISGWDEPAALMKNFAAVFLEDPDLLPAVSRRMEFVAGIIRRQGAKVIKVSVRGASRFERMMKLTALGDFASVYLAFLYGADPTPVERVEGLKRYLQK